MIKIISSGEENDFGFDKDKFIGYISIDNENKEVYITFINAKKPRRGHTTELIDRILSKGYIVKIPNPMPKMVCLCEKLNFKKTTEYDPIFGLDVLVYYKKRD